MASTRSSELSSGDKGVLNSIFNPHLPYSDVPETTPDVQPAAEVVQEDSAAVQEARRLELEGVKAAEAGDLNAALDLFNAAIRTAPEHASAYNNRAQALRLRNDTKGALDDLDMAIELSDGVGKAACQAFTQRGLIRRLEGQNDAAFEDLKKAAGLGSEFARALVVQLNPYAALCNEMLVEVIDKIRRGESVEQ